MVFNCAYAQNQQKKNPEHTKQEKHIIGGKTDKTVVEKEKERQITALKIDQKLFRTPQSELSQICQMETAEYVALRKYANAMF